MNQAKQVKVSIFGEQYSFVSDEPQERVQEAAKCVDALLRESAGKMSYPDIKKLAVLIAVQIMSEKLALAADKESVDQKQKQLIDMIDREMYAIASQRS